MGHILLLDDTITKMIALDSRSNGSAASSMDVVEPVSPGSASVPATTAPPAFRPGGGSLLYALSSHVASASPEIRVTCTPDPPPSSLSSLSTSPVSTMVQPINLSLFQQQPPAPPSQHQQRQVEFQQYTAALFQTLARHHSLIQDQSIQSVNFNNNLPTPCPPASHSNTMKETQEETTSVQSQTVSCQHQPAAGMNGHRLAFSIDNILQQQECDEQEPDTTQPPCRERLEVESSSSSFASKSQAADEASFQQLLARSVVQYYAAAAAAAAVSTTINVSSSSSSSLLEEVDDNSEVCKFVGGHLSNNSIDIDDSREESHQMMISSHRQQPQPSQVEKVAEAGAKAKKFTVAAKLLSASVVVSDARAKAGGGGSGNSLKAKKCKPVSSKLSIEEEEEERKRDIASLVQSTQEADTSGEVPPGMVRGPNGQLWPAWVFCTRYSDRPSSGPRARKVKKKPTTTVAQKVAKRESAQNSTINGTPLTATQSGSAVMAGHTGGGQQGLINGGGDDKRPRTAFTTDQLARLRTEFNDNRYLNEDRRKRLADELQLNETQIKIWFQNKRAKLKKASGDRGDLAKMLAAQGLYNHATVPVEDEEEMSEAMK